MKLLIFTLYLIQAIIYGFFYSIPLTYKEVPNYQVLTIFAAASIPYSFKFVIAPFAQLYYLRSYGKRKTWIVFNLIAMGIFTVLMGEVVGEQKYQMWAAVLLMLSLFCSAMKDVSTDALTVQTIENAATASNIQLSAEQLGQIIGLSVFLALISKGYWSDYGIEHEIVTAKTFIRIVATQSLQSPQQQYISLSMNQLDQTLWQAVGHYRHLVMPRYQLCRLGIFFLVISHGLLYFQRTYEYEYIRKQLIDRETLMFLGDVCFIPNIILSHLIGKLVNRSNLFQYYWYVYICSLAIYLGVYLIQAQQRGVIMLLTVLIRISKGLQYYLKYCLLNQMCRGSNSAINFTGLLSLMNLGWNYSIQTELIYMLGYDNAMAIGFTIAALFMIGLPAFGRWIQRGEKAAPVKEE